jgi:hypothetical protein
VGVAVDWDTSLVEPAECDFWLETIGAHVVSPYDGSSEFTRRYSEWRCVLRWAVTTQAQAMAIEGFFAQARGQTTELNIPNFKLTGTVGTQTGDVKFDGAHSAGDTNISISGSVGAFAAGDVVRVVHGTSHERLHYIIGGNGTTSITIDPPLWGDKSNGNALVHRGDGTATTDMRETMLLAAPISGGSIFPSFGSDTTGGLITSRVIELVSSKRAAA